MTSTPAGAATVARAEESINRELHRQGEAILEQAEKKRKIDYGEADAPTPTPPKGQDDVRANGDDSMDDATTPPTTDERGSSSTRKRRPEVRIEDIDPRSTSVGVSTEIISDATGASRDTSRAPDVQGTLPGGDSADVQTHVGDNPKQPQSECSSEGSIPDDSQQARTASYGRRHAP